MRYEIASLILLSSSLLSSASFSSDSWIPKSKDELRKSFDAKSVTAWSKVSHYKADYDVQIAGKDGNSTTPPTDPACEKICKSVVYGFVPCRQCLACEVEAMMTDSCGFTTGRQCVPMERDEDKIQRDCEAEAKKKSEDVNCYQVSRYNVTTRSGEDSCVMHDCGPVTSVEDCGKRWPKPDAKKCAYDACMKAGGQEEECANLDGKCFEPKITNHLCNGQCEVWTCSRKPKQDVSGCYSYTVEGSGSKICRDVVEDECGNKACVAEPRIESICPDCRLDGNVVKCKADCFHPKVTSVTGKCVSSITCVEKKTNCPSQQCPQPGQSPCLKRIMKTELGRCGCREVVCGAEEGVCSPPATNCKDFEVATKSPKNDACGCEGEDVCVCAGGTSPLCCVGAGCCKGLGCCKDEASCCPKDASGCLAGETCTWHDAQGISHEVMDDATCKRIEYCPHPFLNVEPNPLCCEGTNCCKGTGCCKNEKDCCTSGCCKILNTKTKTWNPVGNCAPLCDASEKQCKGGFMDCCTYDTDDNNRKCCPDNQCCCRAENGTLQVVECKEPVVLPDPIIEPPTCKELERPYSNATCCKGKQCCSKERQECCPEGKYCCTTENNKIRVVGDTCCRGDGCCKGDDCCKKPYRSHCCNGGCFATCGVLVDGGKYKHFDHDRESECKCREDPSLDIKCKGNHNTGTCSSLQKEICAKDCDRMMCKESTCPAKDGIFARMKRWARG